MTLRIHLKVIHPDLLENSRCVSFRSLSLCVRQLSQEYAYVWSFRFKSHLVTEEPDREQRCFLTEESIHFFFFFKSWQ